MCLCMRGSPSLGCNNVLPNPLNYSHVSPNLQPSHSTDYYLDVPISNPMIFDANVNLGYEDNMFSMLGGNVHDFVSLSYFRGHDPSIGPYCVCLEDLPKKVMWTNSLILPMIFLRPLIRLRGYLHSLV